MTPIRHYSCNVTFTAAGCADLPAYVEHDPDRITTVWELTAEERARLAAGANILLCLAVRRMPPVAMEVEEQKAGGSN